MQLESLVVLILVVAVIGFLLWIVYRYVPMPDLMRTVLTVVVAIGVVLWVLYNLLPAVRF